MINKGEVLQRSIDEADQAFLEICVYEPGTDIARLVFHHIARPSHLPALTAWHTD
jgi:hypothetical protein